MNKKITIILIALIGIGLYAMPQTLALFAGQHSFTNIDATGNQIDCTKCHGDVQAELQSSGISTVTGTASPHASFKCEYCHRIEAGSASGDNAYAIVTYAGTGTPRPLRTIAMTVSNFEEENFPATINNIGNLSVATGGFMFVGGAAISPQVLGTENVDMTLTLYNEYIRPTYNSTTGQPYDTSAVKMQGLALQKNGVTNWTQGSRYWTPTLVGAGSRVVNPGSEYHAATLVSCLECHGGAEPFGHYSRVLDGTSTASCEQCHYGYTNRWTELSAGGFGLTGGSDTGSKEAHMAFQMTNDSMSRQKNGASNGACVACHTHVAVDITFTRPDTYKFDAVTFSDGTTVVGGFAATGENVTHS